MIDSAIDHVGARRPTTAGVAVGGGLALMTMAVAVLTSGGPLPWAWVAAMAALAVPALRRRRSPDCPACGMDSSPGHRSCRACGHDLPRALTGR